MTNLSPKQKEEVRKLMKEMEEENKKVRPPRKPRVLYPFIVSFSPTIESPRTKSQGEDLAASGLVIWPNPSWRFISEYHKEFERLVLEERKGQNEARRLAFYRVKELHNG